ncbi:hypothetical protein A5886_001788 [Enterococcus sp. 8G7_MSG3316]|uniref:ABC transporter permease n=1 Tax=Candidatus Enterococcus testudinis TaxID=1834191 RepID=A0A242A747_9ENTE|nr:hypothetical protein [Enterococcus sp. 8G7_MSG3316]OTN76710.1 hypothetical protein A5886_001788 [Enterococcus sp. 8G7_MSG3316]
MHYFYNLLIKSIRQRLFYVFLAAAFCLGIGFSLYLKLIDPIQLSATTTAEQAQASRLVNQYQNGENGTEEEQAVYDLVLQNYNLTSRQSSNLIMEMYPRFNETSLAIADVQLKLWQASLEENDFLQPVWLINQNKVFYQALIQQEKTPVLTADNAQTALSLALLFLMNVGFVFWAFLASDNLLEEREHFTLIRSYPQIFLVRMVSKIMVKAVTNLGLLLSFLTGVVLSMLVIGSSGDWSYPSSVYLGGTWQAVPFVQFVFYSLISILLMILLAEVVGYLANIILPNRYVSFFILLLLYGISYLAIAQHTFLAPIAVLRLEQFYTGAFAWQSGSQLGVYGSWVITGGLVACGLALILLADKKQWILRGGR